MLKLCYMTRQSILSDNRIINSITQFFYSPYFAMSAMLTAFLSFYFSIWYVAFIYYVVCACIIFIFIRDITPIIPLVFCVCFIFRDFNFTEEALFYCILAPVATCIIAHFFIYPIKDFKFGKLFLPILIVSFALFASGLLSDHLKDYPRSIVNNLLTGPAILFIYLLFANYIEPPQNFDLKTYFCMALVCSGLLIAIEVTVYYYHIHYLSNPAFSRGNMGWGNTNGAAMVLLLSAPAFYYFMSKSPVTSPYVFALAFIYLATYFSGSDGCLVILIAFTPFMLFFTLKNIKNYTTRLIALAELSAVVLIVAIFLFFIKPEFLTKIYEYLLDKSSNNSVNVREKLYKEAISLFLKYPIFGAGMGYYNEAIFSTGQSPFATYYVHSTLFQVLGLLGLVGFFAYLYYFIERFRILMGKNTAFNLATFFSFTMLTCYGFIDTCEFSIVPSLLFTTILLATVEIANSRNPDLLLPRLRANINYSKV